MLRVILFSACLAAAGCASQQQALVGPAPAAERQAVTRATSPVTPVALAPSPSLRGQGPVGLAPCDRGAFYDNRCWRKGDHHVLYPDASPGELGLAPEPALTSNE